MAEEDEDFKVDSEMCSCNYVDVKRFVDVVMIVKTLENPVV